MTTPFPLPTPDIFGPILSTADVRKAVLSTLQAWIPTYVTAIATRNGLTLLPFEDYLYAHGTVLPSWTGYKPGAAQGSFEFLHNSAAMTILGSYIVAYAARIYIMNYYKNTRGKGVKLDSAGSSRWSNCPPRR